MKRGDLKKPRKIIHEFSFGRTVQFDEIRVNHLDGTIQVALKGVPVPIESAVSKTAYDRAKGEKVLFQVPGGVAMDLSGAFSAHSFDWLIAVDTNTKESGAERISITGALLARAALMPGCLRLERLELKCYEFRNVVGKPENLAWREVLRGLPLEVRGKRIGLVVDSDLGQIESYNSQTLPIYENFYLPTYVKLIYASSDFKNEHAYNLLISRADAEAREILEHVISHLDDHRDLRKVEGRPFTHFRRWVRNLVPDSNHITVPRRIRA